GILDELQFLAGSGGMRRIDAPDPARSIGLDVVGTAGRVLDGQQSAARSSPQQDRIAIAVDDSVEVAKLRVRIEIAETMAQAVVARHPVATAIRLQDQLLDRVDRRTAGSRQREKGQPAVAKAHDEAAGFLPYVERDVVGVMPARTQCTTILGLE